MTNILKQTKSLCPTCLTEIDATVVEENNNVYMIKECAQHGKFKALVEKDVEFYKSTLHEHVGKKTKLLIPFTHKCNLNCNFCWLPQKDREDFSLQHLKEVISNSNCKEIRICGGEPTLRNDLPELIRFIRTDKKLPVLMTNGLKLADFSYVKKLKNAGLDVVSLSFNSFDDDTYKNLNGRKLLQIKLKALENLKKVGMFTSLSVMVDKGLNDKELKKIFDYCIENNSFIKELRIRSSAEFGKYKKSDTLFVSEMITIFSKILNIDREEFLKIIDRNKYPHCSFGGHVIYFRNGNKWLLIEKASYNKMISKLEFFIKMVLKFKFKILLELIMNELIGKNNLILSLELKSWPNKYNIDLDNINKRCVTDQLSKNGKFPFCYSLILNNENIIDL